MPFLALGVEHKTSPLAVREAAALDLEAAGRLSTELRAQPGILEAVVLSTCNRTEIYLFVDDPREAAAVATAIFVSLDSALAPYIQTWEELDAVERLFRVACGIESQVLGEPQILQQVRETLDGGQRFGSIGPNLHALFRAAIGCARQARAATALGRLNGSLGTEAVAAAEAALDGLAGRTALLVGGGEISRLVGAELRSRAIGTLYIANRTESVAVELAARYGGRAVRMEDISRLVAGIDLIISATSAPRYVLSGDDLPVDGRAAPLHIFDLAIPRDVDPAVGALPNVVLHDLDDLLPLGLQEHWRNDIRAMEAIIAAEVKEFTVWYLTRRAAPVIASLRAHVEAVSRQELRRVGPQLANLTDRERAAVESLTQRLIDKMFHHLVVRLRLAAQTDATLVDAAEFFFLHGEGGLFEHAAGQTGHDGEQASETASPGLRPD
jgi:glutamyl-tRNA reductase